MADPRGDIGPGDWLTAIITVVLACVGGVASAMAWFKGDKDALYERIERVEQLMRDYETIRSGQATQLAVLESRFDEIKETIQDSALRGAHSVNTQLAAVLSEVQKVAEHQRRRT